jgi:YbgC/YbaW family acyl-CoA thioester hydrolase
MGGRVGHVRVRVRFNETDAAGIVFYANFFVWADSATQALLRMGEVSGRGPDGKPRFSLAIVECGATFLAPARVDDELTIETVVESMGASSARFVHTIAQLSGDVIARVFEQRVLIENVDGKVAKKPLPDDLRRHLEGA